MGGIRHSLLLENDSGQKVLLVPAWPMAKAKVPLLPLNCEAALSGGFDFKEWETTGIAKQQRTFGELVD